MKVTTRQRREYTRTPSGASHDRSPALRHHRLERRCHRRRRRRHRNLFLAHRRDSTGASTKPAPTAPLSKPPWTTSAGRCRTRGTTSAGRCSAWPSANRTSRARAPPPTTDHPLPGVPSPSRRKTCRGPANPFSEASTWSAPRVAASPLQCDSRALERPSRRRCERLPAPAGTQPAFPDRERSENDRDRRTAPQRRASALSSRSRYHRPATAPPEALRAQWRRRPCRPEP